jgi:hypothetical protein
MIALYQMRRMKMKKTVKYNRVEKVIYEFDEWDIKKALLSHNKIKEYDPDRTLYYELYEGAEDRIVAEIVLKYVEEIEEDECKTKTPKE